MVELTEGESTAIGPVMIQAIPARHSGFRPPSGPRVRALGYLLRGSQTAYFAGDTGRFEGMASLGAPVDLALLPVGGWGPTLRAGHLDPRGAAEVLRLIRPRAAVPIHWGTFWPAGLSWLRPSRQQLPGIDFAEHAARLAPEVAVEVLDLGESIDLARLVDRGGADR